MPTMGTNVFLHPGLSRFAAFMAGAAAVALLCAHCGPATPAGSESGSTTGGDEAPWFEDVIATSGIDYVFDSTFSDRHLMPESIPGGVALFDMDNDGDLDIYFVQSGDVMAPRETRPTNRLYENLGGFRFRDVTEASGTGDRGFGMGVACGDYDNDGDIDLYVTNLGPNVLFRNEGGAHFTDITAAAGVGHEGWGTSAAFLDYDRDGDLDLFFCNYINWSPAIEIECYNAMNQRDYCQPRNYDRPTADTLYRNNGDGTFTDVSAAVGLDRAFGNGLGVGATDFDGDGRLDLFVANDTNPDHLWLAQPDGTFRERALLAGCAVDQEGVAKAGMGVAVCDVDDDGDADLLVGNLARESDSFYLNDGGSFTDSTIRAGLGSVSRRFTRFGLAWADFDADGRLDLYQANGRVLREETMWGPDPYAEPNVLYRGLGPGRFEEVLPRGGTASLICRTSRGAAFGDLDNDGAIDIVVVNVAEPPTLLRNIAQGRPRDGGPGHWLMLRVLEKHGRDAVNARVTMTIGTRRITREVQTAYSYFASNDPRIHIGLGAEAAAREVLVQWIDGTRESFGDLAGDQIAILRRGEGVAAD